jgi:hypothetical protein
MRTKIKVDPNFQMRGNSSMENMIYKMLEEQAVQEFNFLSGDSIQVAKDLLSSVEAALKNKDFKKLRKISKKLPSKDYPTIFKMADKQFTDFKRNYTEAKRKVVSKNLVDEKSSVPVAIGTAIVASSLKRDVDTIIKDVTKNLKDKKAMFFLIPGSAFLFKTIVIILLLCWIYVTNGAAIVTILKAMALLLMLLGKVISGGISLFESMTSGKVKIAGEDFGDTLPSDSLGPESGTSTWVQ